MKTSWLLPLLLTAQSAQALPRLTDLDQLTDIDHSPKISSRLLRDHANANALYITPAYVDVAKDRSTGEHLFKLSLSQTAGTGELSAVLRLAYDQASVAADWQKEKALHPQAMLQKLPIFGGKFGIELNTEEFSLMIGRSEMVLSDLENGLIPLSIDIHPEGVQLLRALNSIVNGKLMSLTFSYSSRYFLETQPISTTVLISDLLRDIGTDRLVQEAWDRGLVPSRDALQTFLIRRYQQGWFTFGSDQPDLHVLAQLLLPQLQDELSRILARPVDLAVKADVEFLKARVADGSLVTSMQMKLVGQGEERIVENAVDMAFRNVCQRYAQRVYIEETGESKCFDFDVIGSGSGGDDDDVWVPF